MGLHNRRSLEPWISDDIDFYTHQVEGVRRMIRMRSGILGDDMGLGKLQAVDEPVLTPSGWRCIGDICAGDKVIAHDGHPTMVTGIYPQGVRENVRVTFSDGTSTMCGWEHLWEVNTPVRKYRGAEPLVLTTRQIVDRGLKHSSGNRKFYIPMVEPVHFDVQREPEIDPYLLGVLLGDGSYSGKYGVSLTTDREIVRSLVLPGGVLIGNESPKAGDPEYLYRGYLTNGMRAWLGKTGIKQGRSETKYIPEHYLWGSVQTRVAVLQGLLDTDGSPVKSRGGPSTSIEYSTASKQLSEDVRFLVQSLGGTVSTEEKLPRYTYKGETHVGQTSYRMVLSLPSHTAPFRLARKLERWTPRSKYEPSRAIESVEVVGDMESVCIKVDNPRELYVTRDFIVTHNTIQILTVFAAHVKQGHCERAIVVCPASIKSNWSAEIAKFTGFPHVVVDGPMRHRIAQLDEFRAIEGPKILVVNYEQVRSHLDALNSMLLDFAIFDEAHMLKNPRAERTVACRKLMTKHSWMLTGSPIMHNVSDLWVLLDRVSPGAFRSYHSFRARFCAFGGYKDKQVVGVKNERELSEALGQIMLRRMKSDVLDLPEVQYITRTVGMEAAQQRAYDVAYKEMRLEFGAGEQSTEIANAAVRFLRCRQICGTTLTVSDQDHSEKLSAALVDLLQITDSGNHAVVFTQFRKVQEAYIARIRKARPDLEIFELNGDVDTSGRLDVVDKWAASECAVLVATYQVAGVGLNMTRARYAQLLDKFPSPALVQQAIDRLHRIGASESHPIQVLAYIAKGTVEHRIEQILGTKSSLSRSIVDAAADARTASLMRAVIESDRKLEEYNHV